jgi:predicted lipoprotein with Yx(FWY)xxD motif
MSRPRTRANRRRPVRVAAILATVGALSLAAGTAARTFTLRAAKNAAVTNQAEKTTHENIVVTSSSRAVYLLTGDGKTHPECTRHNSCFTFWPPVTVASTSSLSKGPGVPGRLGIWRRDGFDQVTLNGHPLYTYALDMHADHATGQGVKTYGGTWYVIRAKGSSSSSSSGGW